MEALIELDGVGRKTANVVLGNAFDIVSRHRGGYARGAAVRAARIDARSRRRRKSSKRW